jgi:hypothetical protein
MEGGGACSLTQVSSSVLWTFLKTGNETAEATFLGEMLLECSGFIHCVYNGTGLKGHALGPLQSGDVTFSEQTLNKVSGFLCPKTAKLSALIGPLTALYFRN